MKFEELSGKSIEPKCYNKTKVKDLPAGLWVDAHGQVCLVSRCGGYDGNMCILGLGAGYTYGENVESDWTQYTGPGIVIRND